MLKNKIALVTGASRGIGRGIALQLGENGATVYITGRKPAESEQKLIKTEVGSNLTLDKTAKEINSRGGKGIALYCDHSKSEEVKTLFEKIAKDTNNILDILVNNAYAGVAPLLSTTSKKFYDSPIDIWDSCNNVGLRNHYICSVYAAKMMVPKKEGMIVTISSRGGLKYLFGTAYGVGKAACDRLAADMAYELKDNNICSVSVWPGPVKTEMFQEYIKPESRLGIILKIGESTEFAGKCIVALTQDQQKMEKSGKILTTYSMAKEYNLFDVDGTQPQDHGEDEVKTINEIRAIDNISKI